MNSQQKDTLENTRRHFLAWFGGTGITSLVFPSLLWEKIQNENDQRVTIDMIIEASRLAGLEFTREEQEVMIEGVNKSLATIDEIRDFHIDNSIPSPLYFNPLVPGVIVDTNEKPFRPTVPSGIRHKALRLTTSPAPSSYLRDQSRTAPVQPSVKQVWFIILQLHYVI